MPKPPIIISLLSSRGIPSGTRERWGNLAFPLLSLRVHRYIGGRDNLGGEGVKQIASLRSQ